MVSKGFEVVPCKYLVTVKLMCRSWERRSVSSVDT
jgi:hypothetical protein